MGTVGGPVRLFGEPVFASCGLYHSLTVDLEPNETGLQVDATAPDGEIMALSHVEHPVFGVQFHPESILTEQGQGLLGNFLRQYRSVPCL